MQKVKAAQARLAKDDGGRRTMAAKSQGYIKALRSVQEAVAEVTPLVTDASAAARHVDVVFLARRVQKAADGKEDAKDKLEDRKEEIKESQERFKGALGLVTKLASVKEWVEIVPEALAFADEQLFSQLPKKELEQLKKDVERATEKVRQAQDILSQAEVDEALLRLQSAHERLDNARQKIVNRMKDLKLEAASAISSLAQNPRTVDLAKMIASNQRMDTLLDTAEAKGQTCLELAGEVGAECRRVAELYAGFRGIARDSKTLDSSHAANLVDVATKNGHALGTWAVYLKGLAVELADGLATCRDRSDKGFLQSYLKLEPIMQDVMGS